ncbi:MAG: peptide ABC transporter substrate-binding protein [Bdellovibrionales bacterium]|nr:peptide ABC transporter substrate-binding protein [Bdellovibrionales bacterium]
MLIFLAHPSGLLGLTMMLCLPHLGCTPAGSNLFHRVSKKDTSLKVYLGAEPDSLDWTQSRQSTSFHIANQLMSGLFIYDPQSSKAKVKPLIIDHWSHSRDFKTWFFKIRKNIHWSDGQILLAQHYVDAWKHLLSPQTASPTAYKLFAIKNAEKFHRGELDFSKVGMRKLSPYSFSVELEKPNSYFPELLIGAHAYPMRVDLLKGSRQVMDESFVGIGPYQIGEVVRGNHLVLKSNPHYFSKKPFYQHILIPWLEDPQVAVRLFKKKELDFIVSPPSETLSSSELKGFVQSKPGAGITFLAFQLKSKMAQSLAFRELLRAAINKEALVKVLHKDLKVAHSLVPSFVDCSSFEALPAKSFEESFYRFRKEFGSNDPMKITITSNNSPENKVLLEALQSQWSQISGVHFEIQLRPNAAYFSQLFDRTDFEIYRLTWAPDYLQPAAYLSLFSKYSKNNYAHYENESFETLLQGVTHGPDQAQRASACALAQKQLIDKDQVVIPLYYPIAHYLVSKKIKNAALHFSQRLDFSLFR